MYKRKDAYYTRAKESGLRSRAAYKLEDLDRQHRIFRRGDRVADLGAWPGGWLQVAAAAVGPGGRVVGLDLQAIAPFPALPQIVLLQADLMAADTPQKLRAALGGPAQVVISDAAPKLSGVRDRDRAVAYDLAARIVELAREILSPGGRMVIKLFMSDELAPFLTELRREFDQVRTTRPDATRKGSTELYAVATGFRRRLPE